jgi:hypothetical protein
MAEINDPNEITPGSRVHVQIVKRPTNEAAIKTIRRVLAKDPDIKREHKRLSDVRAANLRFKQRGGRPWGIRVSKRHPVKGQPGEEGTVLATLDVIRDLASCQRFLKIQRAG